MLRKLVLNCCFLIGVGAFRAGLVNDPDIVNNAGKTVVEAVKIEPQNTDRTQTEVLHVDRSSVFPSGRSPIGTTKKSREPGFRARVPHSLLCPKSPGSAQKAGLEISLSIMSDDVPPL